MEALKDNLLCTGCNKKPHQIREYIISAKENDCTPEEIVLDEEGTLNTENGHFLCTLCFIRYEKERGKLVNSDGTNWVAK